ncbi:MAG TPA: hypothetical protein VHB97_22915 [Polyangia bacterium]|nr:hypothetical protein [Polyangia bacterium]
MSAAQLDLDAVFGGLPLKARKKRTPITRVTCKCGHAQDLHDNRRHTGKCALCFGECKRFRPKSKPPVEQPANLLPPNGAIILERDDTKRAKVMGWAVVEPARAEIYLAQLNTKSLNKNFFGGSKHDENESALVIKSRIRQRFAWQGAYKDACRDRATSAIAQCGADVAARGRPSLIQVTRVSPAKLDKHDNVRGALKYVVDGIAIALGFNDAELEDSPSRVGEIAIRYEQEKSGVAHVCGVRIEITWRT